MLRPETDWSAQSDDLIADFAIESRFNVRGADLDIRRFAWVRSASGPLAPQRHYLHCSLVENTGHSLLKTDVWKDEQSSGQMLYLSPRHVYWGKPALRRHKFLCVSFNDDFLDTLFEEDGMRNELLPSANVQSRAAQHYCRAIALEMASPGFASQTLIDSLLIGAVVELARQLRGAQVEGIDRFSLDWRSRRIVDYVEANLSSTLGIAEIAQACGMSARHVARVFKNGFGMGLGEFVAQRRIVLAKTLLASDHCLVKDVSWRCGFLSTSAFSAAFRKATGMTPREFRQKR